MKKSPDKALQKIINRFMIKVNRSDDYTICWIWTGAYSQNTGPQFFLMGAPITAQRASYMIFNRSIDEKMPPGRIYRNCGNRKCVNPIHLYPKRLFSYNLIDKVPEKDLKNFFYWKDVKILASADKIDLLRMKYNGGKDLQEITKWFQVPRRIIIQTLLKLRLDPWKNEDLGPIHSPEKHVPKWLQ